MPVNDEQDRPAAKRCKVVGYASVGKQPKEFLNGEHNIAKMVFRIHDFANRKEKRGEKIVTPTIKAHGDLWCLCIHPRGSNNSKTDSEYVSIDLAFVGEKAETDRVVEKAVVRTKTINWNTPKHEYSNGKNFCRKLNFVKREDAIEKECNDAGTLTITVELQVATEKKLVWFPQLKYRDNIIGTQLYRSMETSDVSFIVGDSKTELRGHKCMIKMRSPSLYDLIETEKESSSNNEDYRSESKLVLPDIDVLDFTTVLEFMYTDKVPTWKKDGGDNDIEKAKTLLRVADRLGCTDLKLYMESTLVETFLAPSTAADLLLLADSHNCALLKEETMKMYMIDSTSFIESNPANDCWKKLQESPKLLTELLLYTSAACAGGRTQYSSIVDGNRTSEEADGFDVTSLRERLEQVDLDVDGSREILVDRWKNYLLLHATANDDKEAAAEDDDDGVEAVEIMDAE
mmetsp:Transcript_53107/g.57637  ORF Transcript_53107/g.57637 Transcript_53107/m.57637 type:complete len:458 (-) Transcript_53107:317-1690(-)